MAHAGRSWFTGWRRDLSLVVASALVTGTVTYWQTVKVERQRQLVIGRQADQLKDASLAVVSIANHVSAFLGASDHLLRAVMLDGGASEREAGRLRWNAADSSWMANKIGLAYVLERAAQSDSIDAAWSHMDSTVFALGEALNASLGELKRARGAHRTDLAAALTARRDTAQAALEHFLRVMDSDLAIR